MKTELERLYKEYRAAKMAKAEERARSLMERINEIRRAPNDGVTYCKRERITTRCQADEADELRKRAAVFKFCMRAAQRAEAAGNKSKAETMRAKAAEYSREMSMIRRSSRRTIDTPTGAPLRIRSERPGK